MIRGAGPFSILTLRIGLSAWLLLVVTSALGGVVLDIAFRSEMAVGLSTAFLASLVVFPPVCLVWGLRCAWRQNRALAGIEDGPGLLSVGCRRSVHVELSAEEALRLTESAVRAVFVVSRLQANATGVAARVSSIARSQAFWPWRFEDQLRTTVEAQGEHRCVLRIAIDPVHVWLYGLIAVDGGRCAQSMRTIETALQDRIWAQHAVVDDFRRREANRARASEAQLAMLRAHVEPHFIFNTLAHVRASLGPQSETAAAMLDALVDFLRRNSRALNGEETRLRDEFGMADRYLRIIGLRLGERLRYDLDCPPELLDCVVPAACLLVLAENAVKHGIERSLAGGRIAVRCERTEEGGLRLSVANDGPPFDADGSRRGGLSNLQERIKLMYGASRPLEVEHSDAGEVRVSVVLPPLVEPA